MPPAGLLPIVLLTVELIGCAVNASFVAGPITVRVNVPVVSGLSVVLVAVMVIVPPAGIEAGVLKVTEHWLFVGVPIVQLVGLKLPTAGERVQLMLLPFEPPYFERVGLACSYVGHPVLESGAERGDATRFRAAHGIAYRLNPLTEALLDRLLHVRRYSLVNLLLDRPVVPELVRGDCNPERIAAELSTLIRDERVRSAHREGYDQAIRRLAAGGVSPSRNAADKILAIIAARRQGEPAPQREGLNPR